VTTAPVKIRPTARARDSLALAERRFRARACGCCARCVRGSVAVVASRGASEPTRTCAAAPLAPRAHPGRCPRVLPPRPTPRSGRPKPMRPSTAPLSTLRSAAFREFLLTTSLSALRSPPVCGAFTVLHLGLRRVDARSLQERRERRNRLGRSGFGGIARNSATARPHPTRCIQAERPLSLKGEGFNQLKAMQSWPLALQGEGLPASDGTIGVRSRRDGVAREAASATARAARVASAGGAWRDGRVGRTGRGREIFSARRRGGPR
jgi:hypothetical protein